jgi:molecular chaperone GrpE
VVTDLHVNKRYRRGFDPFSAWRPVRTRPRPIPSQYAGSDVGGHAGSAVGAVPHGRDGRTDARAPQPRTQDAAVAAPERPGPRADEELERAKARLRKDAAREVEQRKRTLVLGFIEVLDDLDRALEAARGGADSAAITDGVALVRKRFLSKLEQIGVTHRPALGERFDPAYHEAVSRVSVADADRDGAIVGVIRQGYDIGDEVLRPASVAVAKAVGGTPADTPPGGAEWPSTDQA